MQIETIGDKKCIMDLSDEELIIYLSLFEERHAELSNWLQDKNKTEADKEIWKREKRIIWSHHKAVEAQLPQKEQSH